MSEATRAQKIRLLKSALQKLESEENKDKKIENYARVILRLTQLVYSRAEKKFLLSCVEDRIASGRVEEAELELVGSLKKKLETQ